MRIMFGNWKYIFKNLWFVLPFAIVPGIFLALSLDIDAVTSYIHALFSGNPRVGFIETFQTLSVIRVDGWLGVLFGVCAVISIVIFMSIMLALVEKHMRIGKRTFSGAFSQLGELLLKALLVTFVYLVTYELWALVVSALFFLIGSTHAVVLVYILDALAFLALTLALLYVVTAFYLWFPCMQITCFRPFPAFVYAYRLTLKVRWKLVFALAISYFAALFVLFGASFLPVYLFRIIAFVVQTVLFLGFCVRMETAYFATDKLDREDYIRSYRELL